MELAHRLWPALKRDNGRILLLHGMGGTGALWRPIAAMLEDDFNVLAPDQRGHGGSKILNVPGSREEVHYTPLDYGRDLVETMGKLEFHPVWAVGHSMGVRSACALAHLKPEWVKGLVLIDLGFAGAAGGGLGDGLANFLKVLPMQFETRDAARAFMATHCPDPAIGQYLMAVSIAVTAGKPEITFPFDKAALISTIEAVRDASVRGWIKEAGMRGLPVLVLRGAESLVWSHEEFEQEKQEFQKYPSIVFEEIKGTGHGLPFEKRREFLEELRRFIKY